NNRLTKQLVENGQAEHIKPGTSIRSDYKPINRSNTIVVKDDLYSGLKAIVEPDYIGRATLFRSAAQKQALIKTIDLSMSFFHHANLLKQFMFQSKFGLDTGMWKNLIMGNPDFKNIMIDAAEHGMMTSSMDANLDYLKLMS